jgi:hypothetical protein
MSDIKFEYRYNNILILRSLFSEPQAGNIEDFKTDLSFNIDTSLKFLDEGKSVITDLLIKLFNEEQEAEIFEIQVRHIFDIKSESELISEDEDGEFLDLPKKQLFPFISIPFSTTRGVVKEKLAGTRFSEFILPIIDPHEIMPEGKVREFPLNND